MSKPGDFAFDGVRKACSIQFRAIGVTSDWVRVRVDEFMEVRLVDNGVSRFLGEVGKV